MFRAILIFGVLALPSGINSLTSCHSTLIPDICPNSKVTFWLYNKHNTAYQLDESRISTIQNATFNNNLTKILVHGYAGGSDVEINTYLRPEYIDLNYNVISVDYSKATSVPCYLETVMNEPIISRCLTEFIIALLKSGQVSLDKIHLIGFSMGAQISGKTGKDLTEKHNITLKRLTGLDAAGPAYPLMFSEISASSALFVDAIHTNGGVFGKLEQIGHIDFYCNTISFQPGCNPVDVKCSHMRALEFFAESIKHHPRKFCGQGTMGDRVEMGERVPHLAYGSYHVTTSASTPYAKDSNTSC